MERQARFPGPGIDAVLRGWNLGEVTFMTDPDVSWNSLRPWERIPVSDYLSPTW
jgi:hypothetical protein